MDNSRFDDLGVLTALQHLKCRGLLHEHDAERLLAVLNSEWGRDLGVQIIAGTLSDQERAILARYSREFWTSL